MRSDTISIYEKAKIFDEVLHKIQASYLDDCIDDRTSSAQTLKTTTHWKNRKHQIELNLATLEGMIAEKYSLPTAVSGPVLENLPL